MTEGPRWQTTLHAGEATALGALALRPRLAHAFVTLRARSARVYRRFATSLAMAIAHVPPLPDVRSGWAMSRPLLTLNLFLAGLSLFFLVSIGEAILAADREFPSRIANPAGMTTPVKLRVAPSSPSRVAYDTITVRTLFHPSRSEPKRSSEPIVGLVPGAALALYGVVIGESGRLAYLEDPATKHVFGYKTGDRFAGGHVERIEMDRVVIRRADGPLEVILNSPNKRRSVAGGVPPVESTAALGPSPATSSAEGAPQSPYRRTPKD